MLHWWAMDILVVEDNLDLVANLYDFFEAKGHALDAAYEATGGLRLATAKEYDVIVLDLGLPGMDGLEVCARLREAGRATPILILTARDTLTDKLDGFHCGADDYLVKPFALQELEARLSALVRRTGGDQFQRRLRVADLEFDQAQMRVRRAGRAIDLSPIPLKILELLMRRSPRVVSREQIERAVWGDDPPDSDALRAHMHQLRSAIDKPFERPLLRTVRGVGYQLSADDGLPP